ncbi:MAG: hypothetical protein V4726_14015 [Verrucomicrobiota bacterium]
MSDTPSKENEPLAGDDELQDRRRFLQGMGKWSGAAIGAAVAGAWFGGAPEARAGAWVNRRVGGGAWINGGGGGGAWVNRRVGGGAWINRR